MKKCIWSSRVGERGSDQTLELDAEIGGLVIMRSRILHHDQRSSGSDGHQEISSRHGHVIQHGAQDRRRRGAGGCEQTRHREDAPHQHARAVEAKCNTESGREKFNKISGDDSVADVLTKKVKSGVLGQHMLEKRFSKTQCCKEVSAAVRSSSAQTAAQNSVQSASAGTLHNRSSGGRKTSSDDGDGTSCT